MKSVLDIRTELRARIAQQMQQQADRLSSGQCQDFAAYKLAVGRIQGNKDALDAVDAVFNKLLDDEGD